MLLTDEQIAVVKAQAKLEPVPADHPFAADLTGRFGEHTFYLAQGGLYIAEPFGVEIPDAEPVVFVRIAKWVDETTREQLATIAPERIEHAVDLKGSL